MNNHIGMEQVIGLYDTETLFYHLHYFPSYEISNRTSLHGHLVRSFKSAHKYPYGMLMKPKNGSDYNDPVYELTDLNNERKLVKLSELLYMAMNPPYAVSGYPRRIYEVDNTCRNDKNFINKKSKCPELDNTERTFPKFKILE